MRNTTSGILIVSSIEEGTQKELESFTCCHCGCVRILSKVQEKTQDGGWCFRCAKLICKSPHCHSNCQPYRYRMGY